ncbi:TPA: conjugal transfer protein TraG N-terminal domain-containing protein, partial [Salmonella enterica]
PTCSEWWSQNKTGLKSRVLDTVNTTTMTRIAAAFKGMVSKEEYTEALIRRLVSPTSLSVSQNGRTYAGYGGNADFTLDNAVNRMASVLGTSVGALGAFPAFDAMRQALPMIQALLLMAMYVLIPLVLVFGTYEYKTVVTLTFVTFGMHFLTFWWELARWLDSWLLEIMYGSDSHSRWNVAGFQNSADDLIMNFVMGTMFLVLPAVWMGALSWAGVRIGGVVESAMVSGSKRAQDAGGKAGGIADKALSGMK